jgi:hypothetical protein
MQTRALLIGESSQGSWHLIKHLERYRCDCRCVTSYQEARSTLKAQRFDLVLSSMRLRDSSLFPLVSQLEGSQITLFYFQAVEEACWWLPALRSGRNCFGSCALRPSEFISSLGQIMGEMQVGSRSLTEFQPPAAPSPRISVAPLPWSSTIPIAVTPMRAKHRELLKRKAAG